MSALGKRLLRKVASTLTTAYLVYNMPIDSNIQVCTSGGREVDPSDFERRRRVFAQVAGGVVRLGGGGLR